MWPEKCRSSRVSPDGTLRATAIGYSTRIRIEIVRVADEVRIASKWFEPHQRNTATEIHICWDTRSEKFLLVYSLGSYMFNEETYARVFDASAQQIAYESRLTACRHTYEPTDAITRIFPNDTKNSSWLIVQDLEDRASTRISNICCIQGEGVASISCNSFNVPSASLYVSGHKSNPIVL